MSVMTHGFPWHQHPDSDEIFLELEGILAIGFRDGEERPRINDAAAATLVVTCVFGSQRSRTNRKIVGISVIDPEIAVDRSNGAVTAKSEYVVQKVVR